MPDIPSNMPRQAANGRYYMSGRQGAISTEEAMSILENSMQEVTNSAQQQSESWHFLGKNIAKTEKSSDAFNKKLGGLSRMLGGGIKKGLGFTSKVLSTTFGLKGFMYNAMSQLTQFMPHMVIFSAIMEGLSPIFELLGAVISVMAGGITEGLMPALIPLIQAFTDAAPAIHDVGVKIGELIGGAITYAIQKFGDMDLSIGDLLDAIEPIITCIIDLAAAGWDVIITSIQMLVPLLQTLAIVLTAIGPALELIIMMFGTGLIGVIYAVGWVIAYVIDAVTAIIDAIDFADVTGITMTDYHGDWEKQFEPVWETLGENWGNQYGDTSTTDVVSYRDNGLLGTGEGGAEGGASPWGDYDYDFIVDTSMYSQYSQYSIPQAATGAFTNTEGLVNVHPNEVILPMSGASAKQQEMLSNIGSGGVNIRVEGNIYKGEFMDEIMDTIKTKKALGMI